MGSRFIMPSSNALAALHADMIVVNARIVTADAAFSIAKSVAIKDGRFIGVGDEADMRGLAGPKTRVLDAGGNTVVPGLIDTHAHVEAAGLLNYTVSFDGIGSVAEALARVADMTARTPAGEWIRGRMWHPMAQLKEKRFLTRYELDEVAPNHPVCLPVGHFTLTNSLALKLAGIDRNTANPDGGEIHRDANGDGAGHRRQR